MDLHGDPEFNLQLYGDSRPRMRVNGMITSANGKPAMVGVSIPVGATEEEKKAIFDSIMEADRQVVEFNKKSREEKLEHYLEIAVDALYKIMNGTHTNLTKLDVEDFGNKTVHRMMSQLSNSCCTADMALCQIPTNFRKKNSELAVDN